MDIPGYTIIRELGAGGMATVYLAKQMRLDREVALKVLKPISDESDDFAARFLREGRVVAQLQDRRIVTIYDFDSRGPFHYFSMEYLPGGTLSERIIEGMSVERGLETIKGVAQALSYAHQRGIIHRDIKPQNILFRYDDTPVLTDFGIAHVMKANSDTTRMTKLGMIVGSPRYMSPQQIMCQSLDARSDLYSLGIVFYEMLTGELPYRSDDVMSLAMKHCTEAMPPLPSHLSRFQGILDKLVAKDPDARFDSADQLVGAIERLEAAARYPDSGDDETLVLARPTRKDQSEPGSSINLKRWFLWGGGTLVLAPALIAGYLIMTPKTSPEEPEIASGLPPAAANRSTTAANYEELAIAHIERGEVARGLDLIRLGLDMAPEDDRLTALEDRTQARLEAMTMLGQAQDIAQRGALGESLEMIEEGLRLAPNLPGLNAFREELEQRIHNDRQEKADKLLAEARAMMERLELGNALASIDAGLLMAPERNDLVALRSDVEDALKQQSRIEDLLMQARQSRQLGSLSESLAQVEEGLQIAPNNPDLLQIQADLIAEKEALIAEQTQDLVVRVDHHLANGEYREALRLSEDGLEDAPGHRELLTRRDEAGSRLEIAERVDALLERAQRAQQAGALDESLSLLTEALRLAPMRSELGQLRDEIESELNERSRIARMLAECNSRLSTEPPLVDSAASVACYRDVLQADDKNSGARAQLDRIAELLVESTSTALDRGELTTARDQLEQLSVSWPNDPRVSSLAERLRIESARASIAPTMVTIPQGCFQMGSPADEIDREDDELQHEVCVDEFRLGAFEVTVAQFRRFVEATGHRTEAEFNSGENTGCWTLARNRVQGADDWGYEPEASWLQPIEGMEIQDDYPVSCVSWRDTQAYLAWLGRATDRSYRLPTEAEWEYAARAGTTTPRFWGVGSGLSACDYANVADSANGWNNGFVCDDGHEWMAPVGQFKPNAWGLYDPLGNVWEWTCSSYDAGYQGRQNRCAPPDSDKPRVLRGGSWYSGPKAVRSAYRDRAFPESRYSFLGFRVVQD
ncbi:SUMF1/EgtB/PvdO family nonheme iron enzyme [Thiocapsa rosea]|uniref:Formylglycine-generating enzyme required for sulfatase activity n=1 Tax=Thiocapsa rosea TaxID=69360 RepID=A0A495VD61_9GAMM|nr:SUMF1/EgtB/PvdO family nonheme iron enzyme [Thiocapsa rosea]RKT46317.1 formylglycine-generating enzyme required for sulfatase activity [Thiocapsa rosea]